MTWTFFLSFASTEKHLGTCVVDVVLDGPVATMMQELGPPAIIAAALTKTHTMKCNPGGEVAIKDVTGAPPDILALYPRNQLLSKDQLRELDQQVALLQHHDNTPAS